MRRIANFLDIVPAWCHPGTMFDGQHIRQSDKMKLALAANVALATVEKRLKGGTIKGQAGERLEAVLKRFGFIREQ